MGVIAQQDEDIESLLQVIAELMARQDNEDTPAAEKEDSEETDPPVQKDDETAPPAENKEDSEDKSSPMNMDSVDQIVRQHLEIARLGDKLGLKGLDTLPVKSARKRIIKAVQPDLRLDGKDSAYIDAAFDMPVPSLQNGSPPEQTPSEKLCSARRNRDLTGQTKALPVLPGIV